jgi:hypothetical protein
VNAIDRKVASDFRSVLLTRVPDGPLAHGGASRALARSSMRPVPADKDGEAAAESRGHEK